MSTPAEPNTTTSISWTDPSTRIGHPARRSTIVRIQSPEAEAQHRRYHARREKGLCPRCSKPVPPPAERPDRHRSPHHRRIYCPDCADQALARLRAQQAAARTAEGIANDEIYLDSKIITVVNLALDEELKRSQQCGANVDWRERAKAWWEQQIARFYTERARATAAGEALPEL